MYYIITTVLAAILYYIYYIYLYLFSYSLNSCTKHIVDRHSLLHVIKYIIQVL